MTGNLQADGVQSRQTLFVRYCRKGSHAPVEVCGCFFCVWILSFRRWRGSCGIFCLLCEVSRKYPSVTCGDSSAQGTPCGCPKGEPECKRASPLGVTPHGVGRCPQGRGDRSVRGEPPIGGGGVLVWNLLPVVRGFTEGTPQSACGCQLSTRHALRVPFQGSHLWLNNITKTATPMHFCIWVWRFCNDWKRKAIPHKERLATLHAICLQIPRHISQKCS